MNDVLLPRATKNEATVIVMRGADKWQLKGKEVNNVIVYSATESRAAHLTPEAAEVVTKRLLKK